MRRKKTPGHAATIGQIAAAWAAPWPRNSHPQQVARSLAFAAGHLQAHQLTPLMANSVLAAWRTKLSHSTAFTWRCVLARLLHHLEPFGGPQIKLPKMRRPEPRAVVADPPQIQRLLSNALPHMRLFVLLCWQLALRFSEALAVTPASWNPLDRTVTIPTKGGKPRCIPTTKEIDDLIDAASKLGDRHTSAINILHGKGLQPIGVRQAWASLCRKAGVQGIHPHDLRRTVLTELYRQTHDIRAVQQYAGHSQMTSTLHYLAPLKEEQLREMHKLLSFHSEVKQ